MLGFATTIDTEGALKTEYLSTFRGFFGCITALPNLRIYFQTDVNYGLYYKGKVVIRRLRRILTLSKTSCN